MLRRWPRVVPVVAGLLLVGCSAEQPRHTKHNFTSTPSRGTSPPIPRHVAAHPEAHHAATHPEAHRVATHPASRHHHVLPPTTARRAPAPTVEASEPEGGLGCKDLASTVEVEDDDSRSWHDDGRSWRRNNCSIVLDLSHDNSTDLLVPVLTNRTIEVKVRLPHDHVLGLRFRRPRLEVLLLVYSAVNVVATSVIPVPVATTLVPLATILFGLLGGLALNVGTTCLGTYLGLRLVRSRCRPGFERLLGPHHARWLALDRALSEHGVRHAREIAAPWPQIAASPCASRPASHAPPTL